MIQVDVIILRRKYPNLHRPFKSPMYPVPQIISIIMILYAIWGMGTEIMLKTLPFEIVFVLYAVLWVKFKMKEPFFQTVPLEEMAKEINIKFDDDVKAIEE